MNVTGKHQYQNKTAFLRAPFAVQFQSEKTGQSTPNAFFSQTSLAVTSLEFNNRTVVGGKHVLLPSGTKNILNLQET